MKFCHVTFSVKNLEDSLNFYQDIIGLTLGRRFAAGPNMEIAFVGSGQTEIELIYDKTQPQTQGQNSMTLGFEVAALGETIEFLKQKGIEPSEVVNFGGQARCVFISDPDQVRVQLIEYIKS